MHRLTTVALAGLLCLAASEASPPARGAASLLATLQTELQRNFQVLKKEPVPAYFAAYTVHDQRSTIIVASNGALDRQNEKDKTKKLRRAPREFMRNNSTTV